MGNSMQRPVARFEDFEVHLETGAVWKAGTALKVAGPAVQGPGSVARTAGTNRYPGRAASADLAGEELRGYFDSGHDGGGYQLWKIPVGGGSPVRVTTKGGVYGIESKDGRFLYYAKFSECGIWKKSLDSGEETRLPINVCDWFDWDLTRDGIYFENPSFPPNGRIEYFDFAHGQTTPILALDKPASLFGGLAVSPDGKSLIFGVNELNESYIMVMKNFH